MFENYSEVACRAIFSARYEASQYGSFTIESEHLLLGIARADERLVRNILKGKDPRLELRKLIDAATSQLEKVSTSVDVPFSNECRNILAYAEKEAGLFESKVIETGHLLTAMLREPSAAGVILAEGFGLELPSLRWEVDSHMHGETAQRSKAKVRPDHERTVVRLREIIAQRKSRG